MNPAIGYAMCALAVFGSGDIVYKLVGPVTPENFERVLKFQIEQALN